MSKRKPKTPVPRQKPRFVIRDGELRVSSLVLASQFGIDHQVFFRSIQKEVDFLLVQGQDRLRRGFILMVGTDADGKSVPYYEINYNGFPFVPLDMDRPGVSLMVAGYISALSAADKVRREARIREESKKRKDELTKSIVISRVLSTTFGTQSASIH